MKVKQPHGHPATAGGMSDVPIHEALWCCLRYAEAGVVPSGRTKDELDATYSYHRLRIAKAAEAMAVTKGRKA